MESVSDASCSHKKEPHEDATEVATRVSLWDHASDLAELLRVCWPLFLGNTLEWYEFAIYGYMELYISENFFEGSAVATWLAFAVTFVARPLGGAAVGFLGDRRGRRTAANASIFGMLVATVGQGLLPSHNDVGIALLILLRFVQGVCAAGEIVSASAYVVEIGRRRSLCLSVGLIGLTATVGFLAALAVKALTLALLEPEDVLAWGWRVPFLAAAFPGLVAVVARRWLPETEAFLEARAAEEAAEKQGNRTVLGELVKTHGLSCLLATASVINFAVVQYGGLVWTCSYLRRHGLAADDVSEACLLSRFVQIVFTFPVGLLADRYGVGLTTLVAGVVVAVFGLPLFALLSAYTTKIAVVFMCFSFGYGLFGALAGTVIFAYVAELFPTNVRTTGIGISYNIGFGMFGGFAPFLAHSSLHLWSLGPGMLLSASGVVTVCAVLTGLRLQRKGLMQLTHIRSCPYFGHTQLLQRNETEKTHDVSSQAMDCTSEEVIIQV